MMDWTDRHCRYFMRLLSPSITLYTEMITAQALRFGAADELLRFDASEHPVVLQLGGSDPHMMSEAASKGAAAGYDAININVGCPSDRVQSGQFGACLMATPDVVADCVAAMRSAVDIPITIKTRIGIDDQVDYGFLRAFIDATTAAGCEEYVIHARKAVLQGLSPKENRTIPPLIYERVYQVKQDYPHLTVVLNGGVTTIEDCAGHLEHVDGVMIGRQAYHDPWFLTSLERRFGDGAVPESRLAVIERMLPYVEAQLAEGALLKHISRHLLGLFAGQPGARAWRRFLSENAHRREATIDTLREAIQRLPTAA